MVSVATSIADQFVFKSNALKYWAIFENVAWQRRFLETSEIEFSKGLDRHVALACFKIAVNGDDSHEKVTSEKSGPRFKRMLVSWEFITMCAWSETRIFIFRAQTIFIQGPFWKVCELHQFMTSRVWCRLPWFDTFSKLENVSVWIKPTC